MHITILTLFPQYFAGPLESSIVGRAQAAGLISVTVVDIRDFATDTHRTTDDRPFGGGPGMVMKVEPIDRALQSVYASSTVPVEKRLTVLTSAKGESFTQSTAQSYAELEELIIICGHYEGVDERVADHLVDAEVRIGEYVLTGGEPAAVVIADAVTRLQPGVLGNEASTTGESHEEPGKLGYPQYTRPQTYNNWTVPDVLLSGDHAAIEEWRESHRGEEEK